MGAPPQILLGSLSMPDTLILMVLALVVFGPRRLPQIGRQLGKLMYEFRKASNDFKFQMEEELRLSEEADRRKKEEAERARALALNPPVPVVEAQAAIGADDQASVSAPAGMYSGEAAPAPESPAPETLAEPGAAEPAPSQEEPLIRYPRINPPATGQPVAAARPGSSLAAQPPADGGVAAEANLGAEPPTPSSDSVAGAEPTQSAEQTSEPARTEPVSQHG